MFLAVTLEQQEKYFKQKKKFSGAVEAFGQIIWTWLAVLWPFQCPVTCRGESADANKMVETFFF